ncbi:hypothetical protein GCM10007418_29090 [Halopseudomonas salina]|uniref:Uncharacterized protein n=1 Tax=Halopseudomonas salina TaxID=1323744 RepID=A0ABQ1PZ98_9GAMM|nr:hypothetical protein GCM10007418_29090 [Halopseudomonas salina]
MDSRLRGNDGGDGNDGGVGTAMTGWYAGMKGMTGMRKAWRQKALLRDIFKRHPREGGDPLSGRSGRMGGRTSTKVVEPVT